MIWKSIVSFSWWIIDGVLQNQDTSYYFYKEKNLNKFQSDTKSHTNKQTVDHCIPMKPDIYIIVRFFFFMEPFIKSSG